MCKYQISIIEFGLGELLFNSGTDRGCYKIGCFLRLLFLILQDLLFFLGCFRTRGLLSLVYLLSVFPKLL